MPDRMALQTGGKKRTDTKALVTISFLSNCSQSFPWACADEWNWYANTWERYRACGCVCVFVEVRRHTGLYFYCRFLFMHLGPGLLRNHIDRSVWSVGWSGCSRGNRLPTSPTNCYLLFVQQILPSWGPCTIPPRLLPTVCLLRQCSDMFSVECYRAEQQIALAFFIIAKRLVNWTHTHTLREIGARGRDYCGSSYG